jgi:hypothetical protein
MSANPFRYPPVGVSGPDSPKAGAEEQPVSAARRAEMVATDSPEVPTRAMGLDNRVGVHNAAVHVRIKIGKAVAFWQSSDEDGDGPETELSIWELRLAQVALAEVTRRINGALASRGNVAPPIMPIPPVYPSSPFGPNGGSW